jgi:hypothetical protein
MAGELVPDFLVDLLAQGNWIGIPGEVRTQNIEVMCSTSRQCCGSGMSIPDPTFPIPETGSRVDKIPDPEPDQRIYVFLTQGTNTKFSKISSAMFIPDAGSWIWIFFHPGSRIQRSRNLRIRNTARRPLSKMWCYFMVFWEIIHQDLGFRNEFSVDLCEIVFGLRSVSGRIRTHWSVPYY